MLNVKSSIVTSIDHDKYKINLSPPHTTCVHNVIESQRYTTNISQRLTALVISSCINGQERIVILFFFGANVESSLASANSVNVAVEKTCLFRLSELYMYSALQ